MEQFDSKLRKEVFEKGAGIYKLKNELEYNNTSNYLMSHCTMVMVFSNEKELFAVPIVHNNTGRIGNIKYIFFPIIYTDISDNKDILGYSLIDKDFISINEAVEDSIGERIADIPISNHIVDMMLAIQSSVYHNNSIDIGILNKIVKHISYITYMYDKNFEVQEYFFNSDTGSGFYNLSIALKAYSLSYTVEYIGNNIKEIKEQLDGLGIDKDEYNCALGYIESYVGYIESIKKTPNLYSSMLTIPSNPLVVGAFASPFDILRHECAVKNVMESSRNFEEFSSELDKHFSLIEIAKCLRGAKISIQGQEIDNVYKAIGVIYNSIINIRYRYPLSRFSDISMLSKALMLLNEVISLNIQSSGSPNDINNVYKAIDYVISVCEDDNSPLKCDSYTPSFISCVYVDNAGIYDIMDDIANIQKKYSSKIAVLKEEAKKSTLELTPVNTENKESGPKDDTDNKVEVDNQQDHKRHEYEKLPFIMVNGTKKCYTFSLPDYRRAAGDDKIDYTEMPSQETKDRITNMLELIKNYVLAFKFNNRTYDIWSIFNSIVLPDDMADKSYIAKVIMVICDQFIDKTKINRTSRFMIAEFIDKLIGLINDDTSILYDDKYLMNKDDFFKFDMDIVAPNITEEIKNDPLIIDVDSDDDSIEYLVDTLMNIDNIVESANIILSYAELGCKSTYSYLEFRKYVLDMFKDKNKVYDIKIINILLELKKHMSKDRYKRLILILISKVGRKTIYKGDGDK